VYEKYPGYKDGELPDRMWPQDQEGYWKKSEELILSSIRNYEPEERIPVAVVVYEGKTLCSRHYAKARVRARQNDYSENRSNSC
jgi:hypothetical protein